jgi:metal-sulfur cluster biosynthetic enzyme
VTLFYQHRTRISTGHGVRPDGSGRTAVTLAIVSSPGVTPVIDDIVERLRAVIDPELGDNIVDLGMVGQVRVEGREVVVPVKLTIRGCPLRAQIQRDIDASVTGHPAVDSVRIEWGEMTPEERSAVMNPAASSRLVFPCPFAPAKNCCRPARASSAQSMLRKCWRVSERRRMGAESSG